MDALFNLSPAIRYVALYRSGVLVSSQREAVAGASAAESDRYEELLVNPTLLTLAKQRGNIDCGGASFVIVGYGNFHQLVIDLPDGHASICFDKTVNPIDFVEPLYAAVLGRMPDSDQREAIAQVEVLKG